MGAPLQIQPGATAPTINDPHAEFRKGRWQKPVVFLGVLAASVAGIVFLVPPADVASAASEDQPSQKAVIGASVSPLILKDPNEGKFERMRARDARPRTEETSQNEPASAPRTGNANFSDAFKSAAR